MARVDVYYTTAFEGDTLEGQDDWDTDLSYVKDQATDMAEDHPGKGTAFVYEISVKPLFHTVTKVGLQSL